jgi:hypothetical protein
MPGRRIGKVGPREELPSIAAGAFFRQQPYDIVRLRTIPQPITTMGMEYDAGTVYDEWRLTPTVTTQIAFGHAPPDVNAPPITANVETVFPVRARFLNYRASAAGASGTLTVRLSKWKDG